MGPDACTLALLLLFAQGSDARGEEETNATTLLLLPATGRGHHGGYGPPYHGDCDEDDDCRPEEHCIYGMCRCARGFYYDGSCKRCPGLNEYCGNAKCCSNPSLYFCGGDHCRCKMGEPPSCREPSSSNMGNVQMMTAFQVILASAFGVALFALLIQCWRTCCGKKLQSRQSAARNSSGPSIVGVEGLSVSRMSLEVSPVVRDAPPRYDDLSHVQFEKPPPYQEVVSSSSSIQVGRPLEETPPYVYATAPVEDGCRGVENLAFIANENQDSPHASSVPEGGGAGPGVGGAGPGDTVVVLAPASLVDQHSAGQSHASFQAAAPADGVVVCQVHKTESSI
ncbi:uncharacterized protein LOC134534446 [Bacillus rossius redtenbacheri]|uniref:uncharacterized protein LOC134534446 n=1 Tax=Bacillus rossius redtenbacheri TaxID=93214 RepID=UPI002FDE69F0